MPQDLPPIGGYDAIQYKVFPLEMTNDYKLITPLSATFQRVDFDLRTSF